MEEWQELSKYEEEIFGRGTVFRVQGEYPHEKWVDFMLIADPESPSETAIMVISGMKSGLTLIRLPKEAAKGREAIDAAWLKANWEKWIYVNPGSVKVIRRRIIRDPGQLP